MIRSVCLVSNELAPLYGGGIGTYVLTMARAWAASGARVHIITACHPGLADLQAELNATHADAITLHPALLDRGLAPRIAGASSVLARSVAAADLLETLHREHEFNLIEFPDYQAEGLVTLQRRAAGLAGAIEGVPIIIRVHSPSYEIRRYNDEIGHTLEELLTEPLEEDAMRLADALVSPSACLLDLVQKRLAGERPLPPGLVVPYPFDRAALADLGLDGSISTTSAEPTILYTGRLETRKGVDTLIDAAIALDDRGIRPRWLFAGGDTPTAPGGGSMLAFLRHKLAARPDLASRVEFLGRLTRRQLGPRLRAATLCVFPSRWENFPYACVEAMAAGAAVVGGSFGGMGELIRHGVDGFVALPDDTPALASAIASALADPARLAGVRRAAVERIAEVCDPARIVEQMTAAVRVVGPAAARDPAPTEDLPVVRLTRGITLAELCTTLRASPWTLVCAAGCEPAEAFLTAACRAARRSPWADVLTAWHVAGDLAIDAATPAIGLDRDWLAAGECLSGGVALVRGGAVPEPPASIAALPASLRVLSAAMADRQSLVIPEPLIVRHSAPEGTALETAALDALPQGRHPERARQVLLALAAQAAANTTRLSLLTAHTRRVEDWARSSDREAKAFWAETETLRRYLTDTETRLRELAVSHDALSQARAAALTELESAHRQRAELDAQLARTQAAAAHSERQLAQGRRSEADLRDAASQIEASLRQTAQALAATRSESQRLTRDLESQRQRADELQTALTALRYRLADRVNDALKVVHVQGTLRALARRLAAPANHNPAPTESPKSPA